MERKEGNIVLLACFTDCVVVAFFEDDEEVVDVANKRSHYSY